MEGQRSLELAVGGDDRLRQRHGLLLGIEIGVRLCIAAENADIALVDEPGASGGIKDWSVLPLHRLGGA